MLTSIISVLLVFWYACYREWLVVLALLCLDAAKLINYLYPTVLPLWLFLSVAGVAFATVVHYCFKQRRRRAAVSIR